MLIFLAAGALAIVLAHQPDLPGADCIDEMQAIADDLRPYAEHIAGMPLSTQAVAGRPGIMAQVIEGRHGLIPVAGINSAHQIEIFSVLCPAPKSAKEQILAHEMGHLIDIAVNPESIFWRSWKSALEPWDKRPAEQIAEAYAREIFSLQKGSAKNER